jgi:hypothetical protein
LIVEIVRVLHLVSGLIDHLDEIAGAIVTVLGGRLIVIGGLEEATARVVLALRRLALAVGDGGLVAGIVIGVGGGGAERIGQRLQRADTRCTTVRELSFFSCRR